MTFKSDGHPEYKNGSLRDELGLTIWARGSRAAWERRKKQIFVGPDWGQAVDVTEALAAADRILRDPHFTVALCGNAEASRG